MDTSLALSTISGMITEKTKELEALNLAMKVLQGTLTTQAVALEVKYNGDLATFKTKAETFESQAIALTQVNNEKSSLLNEKELMIENLTKTIEDKNVEIAILKGEPIEGGVKPK